VRDRPLATFAPHLSFVGSPRYFDVWLGGRRYAQIGRWCVPHKAYPANDTISGMRGPEINLSPRRSILTRGISARHLPNACTITRVAGETTISSK